MQKALAVWRVIFELSAPDSGQPHAPTALYKDTKFPVPYRRLCVESTEQKCPLYLPGTKPRFFCETIVRSLYYLSYSLKSE